MQFEKEKLEKLEKKKRIDNFLIIIQQYLGSTLEYGSLHLNLMNC